MPLAQHQFDALVSFDVNSGGIHRAKLTAAINAEGPDAARQFMGRLRSHVIRKRRTAEIELFRTWDDAAIGYSVPIWRNNGEDKLTGVLLTMSVEDLLWQIAAALIPARLPTMVDLAPASAGASRARAAQKAAVCALASLEAMLVGCDPLLHSGPNRITLAGGRVRQ